MCEVPLIPIAIYTDGLKTGNRVSAAANVHGHELGTHISDQSSIFTAEARALLLALECIETSSDQKCIIFTNSFSCLQTSNNRKLEDLIVLKVLIKLNCLSIGKFDINLYWVPGHVAIPGNERADQTATWAQTVPLEQCHIPHSDLRPTIFMYMKSIWMHEWDENTNSKVHKIIPSVEGPPHTHAGHQWDEVVLSCCHIGHWWLTFSCSRGNLPLNALSDPSDNEHILLNCMDCHGPSPTILYCKQHAWHFN